MDEIPKTDKLFLILHRAGWSIGDTAFVGKEGISWLVYGTKGDHSIQAKGKSQVEAWKAMQAYSICKDWLTKVQETLGQYFEKDKVKGEAGSAGGDVVVKRVLQARPSPDGDEGDSPF
ncbi:MAG: hypothetical protein ABSH35_11120 [Isosphaeraceae bacterium]|jgi:hypothetical protein